LLSSKHRASANSSSNGVITELVASRTREVLQGGEHGRGHKYNHREKIYNLKFI
jgi:hypothetical protein